MAVIDLGTGKVNRPVQQTKRIIDLKTGEVTETLLEFPEARALPDEPEQQDRDLTEYGRVSQAIGDNPVTGAISEFGAGVGRGAIDTANIFVINPINAALEMAGSDLRIKDPKELEIIKQMIQGNTMDQGIMRDITAKAGEFTGPAAATGALLRATTKGLQAIPEAARTVSQNVGAQLGRTTATQDVIGGATAGAGQVIGEGVGESIGGEDSQFSKDTGGLIGSILAPVTAASAGPVLRSIFQSGKQAIQNLTASLSTLSDDGASTLLAEAMVREGMTPDDVIRELQRLGPEAIPADVGNNFSRLLRAASNKIPRIEGHAADVFKARQSGQGNRILSAFDDSTGTSTLTADDEIARLNTILKPEITRLYKEAGDQSLALSPRLQKLLNGKSSLGRAQRKAQIRLADKRAAGDVITNIDLINATKQELDDQIGVAIRQGQTNKVRDLTRLKNLMVDEADKSIPVYKEARDLFSGKASLENAVDHGRLFLKLKPRDVKQLTATYSESEAKMFKLGAKEAILDKIDDIQTNADAVKRIFGKNGDVKKLRHLFGDEESYKRFANTLEIESKFILTRRAAQGNSTTWKQKEDADMAFSTLSSTGASLMTPAGQAGLLNKILVGLSKKKDDMAYIESLEKAGDILLIKGIEMPRIINLLVGANRRQLEVALKNAMKKPNRLELTPAATSSGIVEAGNIRESNKQSD